MSFTCPLYSDKVRCFNQSECTLYGNFIIKLTKSSKLLTQTLQNLREDIILRSDDKEIDNRSGGTNITGGNTLDIESASAPRLFT